MAVPASQTYSTAALVAAHEALVGVIDGEASAGSVTIRDSSDTLLAEITLDDPCGTVDSGTGQLTFDWSSSTTAVASGTAAYGEIRDGNDVAHLSMPAEAGTSAVSGKFVLNTLTIVSGDPLVLISATVG